VTTLSTSRLITNWMLNRMPAACGPLSSKVTSTGGTIATRNPKGTKLSRKKSTAHTTGKSVPRAIIATRFSAP
jgi:L-asparaginase/Glu-tRNA(Gln) amidotransferase subunit D